jgi:hypothetical protein
MSTTDWIKTGRFRLVPGLLRFGVVLELEEIATPGAGFEPDFPYVPGERRWRRAMPGETPFLREALVESADGLQLGPLERLAHVKT